MKLDDEEIKESEEKEASKDFYESEVEKELEELREELSEEEYEELKEIMKMLENKYVKTSKSKKIINFLLGILKRFIVFLISFVVAYGFLVKEINSKFIYVLYFILSLSLLKAVGRAFVNKVLNKQRGTIVYEISILIVEVMLTYILSYYKILIEFDSVVMIMFFYLISFVFTCVLNYYIMKYQFKRLMKGR